jgi:hypothetical protein
LVEAPVGSKYQFGMEKVAMSGTKTCNLTHWDGTLNAAGELVVTMVCKEPYPEAPKTCTLPTSGIGPILKSCVNGVPEYYPASQCQKDYSTGLVWEVKSPDSGSPNYLNKLFANGAYPFDDTSPKISDYVDTMNSTAPCGITSWRLPTADEFGGFDRATLASSSVGRLPGEGPLDLNQANCLSLVLNGTSNPPGLPISTTDLYCSVFWTSSTQGWKSSPAFFSYTVYQYSGAPITSGDLGLSFLDVKGLMVFNPFQNFPVRLVASMP